MRKKVIEKKEKEIQKEGRIGYKTRIENEDTRKERARTAKQRMELEERIEKRRVGHKGQKVRKEGK